MAEALVNMPTQEDLVLSSDEEDTLGRGKRNRGKEKEGEKDGETEDEEEAEPAPKKVKLNVHKAELEKMMKKAGHRYIFNQPPQPPPVTHHLLTLSPPPCSWENVLTIYAHGLDKIDEMDVGIIAGREETKGQEAADDGELETEAYDGEAEDEEDETQVQEASQGSTGTIGSLGLSGL